MFLRLFFLLFFMGCITPSLPSHDIPRHHRESLAPLKVSKPFYWTAETASSKAYFLGTIHLGVDAEELPDKIWADLQSSHLIFTEAKTEGSATTQKLLTLPSGQTIENYLNPEAIGELKRRYGNANFNQLRHFKPWGLYTGLLRAEIPTAHPIDREVEKRGTKLGIQLAYFETLELQTELLDKWFTPKEIEEALKHIDEDKKQLVEAIKAYRSGDELSVQRLALDAPKTLKSPEEKQRFFDEFLLQRNKRWMVKILECLREKGKICFFAVGVGHFYGKSGLIDLLKKENIPLARWSEYQDDFIEKLGK